MSEHMEIELKLLVSRENLRKMLALDFVRGVIRKDSKKKRRLVSSYYDTEDLAFKNNGIAYRVRDKGDGTFEATVKTSKRSGGGLSERLELNIPLQDENPVLEGFMAMGLEEELTSLAPAGVKKLFTVNVERTTYILDLQGACAELAIDRGRISCGRKRDDIDEIEIELLEGDKNALLQFAAALTDKIPMFPEKRSKFTRGMALMGVEAVLPAAKPLLGGGLLRDELQALLAACGEELLDIQAQLRSGGSCSGRMLKQAFVAQEKFCSLLAFAGAVAQSDTFCSAGEEPAALGKRIAKLRLLKKLQKQWRQASDAAGEELLRRSVLGKILEEETAAEEAALHEAAAAGRMTAAVYGAAAAAGREQWQSSDYLQGAGTAECCLKRWGEGLEDCLDGGREQLLQIICLADCTAGKTAAKIAGSARRELRRRSKSMRCGDMLRLLQQLMSGSSGKYLYRDAGLLSGWLLASGK